MDTVKRDGLNKFFHSFCFSLALIFASNAFAADASRTPPKVETYDELVHEVRATINATKERVEQAVEREKVREAWEIGKLIDEHALHHKERADYAKELIPRLAADTGMGRTELYYMLEFARTYPIVRPGGQLSWGHYQVLLSINDPEKRRAVADEAIQKHWSKHELRSELRRRRLTMEVPSKPLEAKPGKLHTYRVARAAVGEYSGKPALDLGFSCYYRPPGKFPFPEGEIVSAQLKKLDDASEEDLFTYEVTVLEVIDGDTFKAAVDLGFGFSTVQTLRLRGLDAREVESEEGEEAKESLKKLIQRPGGPVLIRTVQSDKYDRYLADVFVKDQYINQEMVARGLAVAVEE